MTLSALKATLAEQRQRLLVDAPHPDRATLGGIYATNTTGSRRFGAGRPRDQVIGVSFVTSDGAVVKGGGRVVKNVAGYDFPKLLTGSMGTLGIIVQLTLKVRPIPEASAIAWIPLTGPIAAAERLERLNTSDDPADRPGPAQCPGRPRHRPGAGALRRVPGAGRRLRGQRRLGPLADRPAQERDGPAGPHRRRGRADHPALGRAERLPGGGAGPLESRGEPASHDGRRLRRGARPGPVVGPGPRRQRDRPRPCPGRVDPRRSRPRRSSRSGTERSGTAAT